MAPSAYPQVIGIICLRGCSYSRTVALAVAHTVREAGYRPFLTESVIDSAKRPSFQVAGYVGFIYTRMRAALLRQQGVPVVNVSQAERDMECPSVLPDNRRAGHLAAEHLLKQGYRQIVFAPHGDLEYSRLRGEGVRQAVAEAGAQFTEIKPVNPHEPHSWVTAMAPLPRPMGIVAGDDVEANYILEATPLLPASVPEQIAIVGITNEELSCSTALVPLSSVDLNPRQIGTEAAQLLIKLIAGARPPSRPVLVAPHGVVVRASSDAFATTDPLIAEVLRYARQHLAEGLLVSDLAKQFHVSARHLSRLFMQRTGQSPAEMLQRLAVNQAEHLLRNSPLTIPQIAAQCGYDQVSHFGALFRKLTGTTPAVFRNQPC